MIALRLYLENIAGDWFGWIENYPGAFCQGLTTWETELDAPRAFAGYLQWLRSHEEPLSPELQGRTSADFYAEIVEKCAEPVKDRYETVQDPFLFDQTGFFAMDALPLEPQDLETHLRLLGYARADLMEAVNALPPHERTMAPFGAKSVQALLTHLAEAELALLDRLGAEPTLRPHPEPLIHLEGVRRAFEAAVQACFEKESAVVAPVDGRRWSLRKVLRLALWHERYHTRQIAARSNPIAFLESVTRAVVHERRHADPAESTQEKTVEEKKEALGATRAHMPSEYYY